MHQEGSMHLTNNMRLMEGAFFNQSLWYVYHFPAYNKTKTSNLYLVCPNIFPYNALQTYLSCPFKHLHHSIGIHRQYWVSL